ncbi:hypothetical protein KBZ10_13175 [Streptomyces sp. F63]|nr:hypothetical protein [Streptomyces sp. F63]
MQLNELPDDRRWFTSSSGSAAGGRDLTSSPAAKKAAAKAIENHIEPGTRKAGDWADVDTGKAVKGFRDGWLTSEALKKAHETWGDQVRNLMNRLASEKAALRNANTVLTSTDIETGASTRSVSVLRGY